MHQNVTFCIKVSRRKWLCCKGFQFNFHRSPRPRRHQRPPSSRRIESAPRCGAFISIVVLLVRSRYNSRTSREYRGFHIEMVLGPGILAGFRCAARLASAVSSEKHFAIRCGNDFGMGRRIMRGGFKSRIAAACSPELTAGLTIHISRVRVRPGALC